MTVRSVSWALLFAVVSTAPLTALAGSSVRVGAVQAPAGTDARTRATLSEALQRHIRTAELAGPLKPYTLSPSLVQLRRYVEPAAKQTKLVCVVELTLSDSGGSIVASVRGNASASGVTPGEVIDGAAQAAVSRLPEALQALGGDTKKSQKVAAR